MKPTRVIQSTLLALALIFGSTPLHAINYDVEVIIFEHTRNTAVGISDTLLLPVTPDAEPIPQVLDPANPIQPLPELRLLEHANTISNSANHRLLYHGGWRQPDYSQDTAPYMQIAIGPQLPMFVEPATEDEEVEYLRGYTTIPPLSEIRYDQGTGAKLYGGIKVWVGRFLHFDTLLAYTPRGAAKSFSFKSDRRMRSRQLHYIDNTRVGIITKIFPVDDTAPN